jgi:hypothetical protein
MNKFNELYESMLTESGGWYYLVRWEKDRPIALWGSNRLDKIWYKAINHLGGMPVDTKGAKLDSIASIEMRLKDSPTRIVSLEPDKHYGEDYRKGNYSYAIMQSAKNIKKDKNYEEL